MDFASPQFGLFFVLVVGVCYFLPLWARAGWLLISSLMFYSGFELWFLANLIGASLLAFWGAILFGRFEDKNRRQKGFIVVVVLLILNFLTLRYLPFLLGRFDLLWQSSNSEGRHFLIPGIPIGLSFYTFLLIGYLVDVLRGQAAERNFGYFLLFVSFFPKVIAGPIERSNNFLLQIRKKPPFDYALAVFGLQLILLGLFKKIIVADRLAPFVQQVYDNPQMADGPMLWAATLTYAFQLYFDFSGYSDIAIGCAAVLGYRLIQNFRQPYFATSISDFWKRWHISLTSWLTEYVYNPIVRQRRFKIKLYYIILIAIFSTFLISGVWHGAQWTFVLWGGLHGTYIIVSVVTQKWRANVTRKLGLHELPQLHKGIKIFSTFVLVCFAYILFRAANLTDAFYIMTHLFRGWSDPIASLSQFIGSAKWSFLIGLCGIIIVCMGEVLEERGYSVKGVVHRMPIFFRWSSYVIATLAVLVIGSGHETQNFIYFRF